jgi:hypothetical protein
MILVDYTQVAVAGIMQFQQDLTHGSDEKIVNLIRHVVLSSIVSNKKKFGPKYGEMVICTDGRNYWRKEHFEYYKASRKKSRSESDLNWKLIFDTISQLRTDLAENFPYKVIHNERAEADDIIGVLTHYLQENELVTKGLEEKPQSILILSSDRDNVQLQKYKNVTQWSPMQKKLVEPEFSAHKSLIDKICTGDSGDGIPNIMSPDDVFVTEGTRQKAFKKARLEEFYQFGIDACKSDDERRNYARNELLVSYDKIPTELYQEIVTTYKTQAVKGTKQKIMQYLIEHRCKNLMDDIEAF